MKKTAIYISVAVLSLFGVEARAGYNDLPERVKPIAEVWVGGSLRQTDNSVNSSLADTSAAKANIRVGRAGAYAFHTTGSSASGGVYLEGAPLPSRYHFELDYYDENDWYGDFRYSFKDAIRTRVLTRRFYHNLDNLTLFDYDPGNTSGSEVEIHDAGVDDYGIRVEIDQYQLRFKTPSYPFHVYIDGETVSRKGKRQQRFLGGEAYFFGGARGGRVRVSEARDIDQKSDTIAFTTNAHLGPMEFELSHRDRKFDSDVAAPAYTYDSGITSVHNVVPELKANSNTFKLHTTHSGRLFVSTTFSKLEKTNEYSHAEADRSLSYGEVFWLPRVWVAFSAKLRHQKNTAAAPATVVADGLNPPPVPSLNRVYTVEPGVASTTDMASLSMRYSLIPATSMQMGYTREIKDVEGDSALVWSRPEKTIRDIYEFRITNRAIPGVRTTARLKHTRVGFEYGAEIVNNEPARSDEAKLDLTWTMSPRVSLFANGFIVRDESDENRTSDNIADANVGRALRQQYVASLIFVVSKRFSLVPTYTFISQEQKRDIVWEDGTGAHVVDHGYSNKQTAHNFALDLVMRPVDRLRMNGAIDYTVTKGTFDPTTPFTIGTAGVIDTAEIAGFSATKTKVLDIRLDNELDLGRGFSLGLDLHYADWKDDSFDNPSDSTYFGALFKIMKRLGAK